MTRLAEQSSLGKISPGEASCEGETTMQSASRQSWPTGQVAVPTFAALLLGVFFACALLAARPARAQVNVWTYHNDNLRTGANLHETVLTLTKVNSKSFGLLFSCDVEGGQIYAQPLVLSNVELPDQSVRNLVFVATESDVVYAFDADGPECIEVWKRDFTDPINRITAVPYAETGSGDITPVLGITATPVVDVDMRTLYVVTKTKEVRDSNGDCLTETCNHYVQRLHALNVATGDEKLGDPAVIGDTVFPTGLGGNRAYGHEVGACVSGIGDGTIDGQVCFNALRSHLRNALVLARGVIYLAWSSHSDRPPYQGWVIGYEAASLQQIPGAVFNTAPDGRQGGIWGGALAVDANGDLFFSTGNGTFAAGQSYGDTVVRLSGLPDGKMTVTDAFTPFNQDMLSRTDRDLASGGTLLLPDQDGIYPHVLLTAGKEDRIYLIDRDDMGQYQRCGLDCDDVLATLPNISDGETNGIPAYLNTGMKQMVFYLPGEYRGFRDHLKRFEVTADPPSITLVAEAEPPTPFQIKGAIPSISGNSTETGVSDAIVWTIQESRPAVLHAHAALATPMNEIYNSNQAPGGRDLMGDGLKFTLPTVANGKVYAGTATRLDVFGLISER